MKFAAKANAGAFNKNWSSSKKVGGRLQVARANKISFRGDLVGFIFGQHSNPNRTAFSGCLDKNLDRLYKDR